MYQLHYSIISYKISHLNIHCVIIIHHNVVIVSIKNHNLLIAVFYLQNINFKDLFYRMKLKVNWGGQRRVVDLGERSINDVTLAELKQAVLTHFHSDNQ